MIIYEDLNIYDHELYLENKKFDLKNLECLYIFENYN